MPRQALHAKDSWFSVCDVSMASYHTVASIPARIVDLQASYGSIVFIYNALADANRSLKLFWRAVEHEACAQVVHKFFARQRHAVDHFLLTERPFVPTPLPSYNS
jgi:hypothetical protein